MLDSAALLQAYLNECTIHDALTQTYRNLNSAITASVPNVELSGSTCVIVLVYGQELYVANVGDSRAVIAAVDKQGRAALNQHRIARQGTESGS
jgi:serine/threonine protein phosphatase PrpC